MEKNETLDTIAAQATPCGRGGVGIIRVSGPLVQDVALSVLGKVPNVREAVYLPFFDEQGFEMDRGIALYFKKPNSFTGEDVLEFQAHGGPQLIDSLLKTVLNCGVRIARPGEFTERAFINNKIDLIQAEAIADLINAGSLQALRSASRSLQGVFSKTINDILASLIKLRLFVEASIDFPDEELELLQEGRVQELLSDIIQKIEETHQNAKQGALLSEGIKVVIAGKPNAGKSSLLNCLSGNNTAIVTPIPGTTRDVLKEKISLDGLLLDVVDTAGLRETADIVEEEGVKRAWNEISMADHIIFVVDGTSLDFEEIKQELLVLETFKSFPEKTPVTVLYNKIDLLKFPPKITWLDHYPIVFVSLKTGEGLSLFREQLKKSVGFSLGSEGNFIARRRHVEALNQAKQHLLSARSQLIASAAIELLAEELRLAQQSLDEITGKFSSDDLLGKIFSEFCIGK